MSGIPSFKCILVGSSGVGKTAILKRLVEDTFSEESQSTIGVEFDSTILNIENRRVKLQIWDTAGQERFRSIAKAYYRNAVGVIAVYDLIDRKSFDDLGGWMTDIHALCDANAVVQLIGNKADMAAYRRVSVQEAEDFSAQHHIKYIETSAKSGANVKDAFVRLAVDIMDRGMKSANPAPGQKGLLDGQDSAQKECC
jgi:small GTP-binding protein